MRYIAFFFLLLTSKCLLIAVYGSPVPFWDQWHAEGVDLYKPYLLGELSLGNLFDAHSEHRIFTQRALALTLFILNDEAWSPITQMAVNAVIHSLSVIVLVYGVIRTIEPKYRLYLFVFASLVSALPFAHENIFVGFQGCFYFLLIFSYAFIWSVSSCSIRKAGWWFGLFAGLLAVLSLASGVIALLAGAIIIILKLSQSKDRDPLELVGLVIVIGVSVIAIAATPSVAAHQPLKACSLSQFMVAFMEILSWPLPRSPVFGFVTCIPLVVVCCALLQRKRYRDPGCLFLLGISAWFFGQVVTIAYGRANADVLSSRYMDILAVGLILNVTASLVILQQPREGKKVLLHATMIWFLAIGVGLAYNAKKVPSTLKLRLSMSEAQERNVSGYICTGERRYLENKQRLEIPHPSSTTLGIILDDPLIVQILPEELSECD